MQNIYSEHKKGKGNKSGERQGSRPSILNLNLVTLKPLGIKDVFNPSTIIPFLQARLLIASLLLNYHKPLWKLILSSSHSGES